uniref:Protein-tyrosine phosphatase n=1 Tax=Steinernema glaseri TaxID=37863 RepID=A0A1I7Z7X3_9BILA
MPPKGAKTKKKAPQKSETTDKTSTTEANEGQSKMASNAVAKCASGARAEVERWARRALEKGVGGLREEFLELRRYTPPDMTLNAFNANHDAGRNRYKDVPCQDKYRVVLKYPPGAATDYIHANYVATPINDKRFICTQGPLDNTINDFWRMVVQEETDSIVMLCNITEKGMAKCAQYWPNDAGEKKTYGDIEVTNTLVRALTPEEMTVRMSILVLKYKLDGKEQTREVRHYQWVDWPDRGVPPCRLTSMVLLSHVRGTKKPIVVHCSAGIGRTGTIVAIEFILERLQQGLPCEAMDALLKDLRNQRPFTIQTDLQYLYVHRVMLFYFFEKYKVAVNTEENMTRYRQFVIDYDKATATA